MSPTSTQQAVFVIGATGGIGHHIVQLLAEQGHRVSGLHRADDASRIREAGGVPVRGDIVEDSVHELATHMRSHDAVVFCAGAGGSTATATAVDQDGAKKSIDAAVVAGVRRFVLVSVFMDAARGDDSPGAGFERYIAAKRAADVHLAASDLDFLIVRPGTLTDDPGTGSVSAGVSVAYDEIPRTDVATFIAAALFAPGLNRTSVEVTRGSRSIDEVVAGFVTR